MFRVLYLFAVFLSGYTCRSQEITPHLAYGPCEGCEAILEFEDAELYPVDTLPGFASSGQKLKISGTVYKAGGKSPAADVVLYVYQTNSQGTYENKYKKSNWERRHGYIRGWMKTGSDGKYTFYTGRPGVYPNRSEPAHIHLTIMEPDGKYYWLSSFEFEDDPLIDADTYDHNKKRGGSGLLNLQIEGDLWTGIRDIYLGKNLK